MDKIIILNPSGHKILESEMSQIVRIVYEKAVLVARSLSGNYKKQNQRVEIMFDEISGNYNMRFYNCTTKYGRDFDNLFQQKIRNN